MACLKSHENWKKGEIVFGHKSSLLNKSLPLLLGSLAASFGGNSRRCCWPIVWQTPRNVDIFDKTEIGFFIALQLAYWLATQQSQPNCLVAV